VSRIIKLHGVGADVFQLDKFITAGVRVIHDFVEDDRPNPRTPVGLAGRGLKLLREMFLASADHVATECRPVRRRPKREAVAIAVRFVFASPLKDKRRRRGR